MKNVTKRFALVLFCCLLSSSRVAASTAIIGTGIKDGVYYPVARAICKMVNLKSKHYGFQYEPRTSHGSVSNINFVLNGSMELGFAQSDRQYEAYHGLMEWRSAGPRKDLRSVFSIYSEAVTLVATQKSNIHSLDGLRGKRVNIGCRGSGQHKNSIDVLDAVNIKFNDITPREFNANRAQQLIRDDEIDAFFYTVGHPNKMIQELSRNLAITIVPITGTGIDSLINKYSYYTRVQIPGSLYPSASNLAGIDSIGVTATLITSRKINNHVIYSLVKEVFENLDRVRKCHPALRDLTQNSMLEGLSAPIHEGALQYYREAGLIK